MGTLADVSGLSTARLIAYGLAGAAILGAAGLAWWRVAAWRSAYVERPALVRARDEAVAHLASQLEAARKAAAVAGQLQTDLDVERQRKARVVRVYRDAVSADPTCAAWASQPIPCPMVAPP